MKRWLAKLVVFLLLGALGCASSDETVIDPSSEQENSLRTRAPEYSGYYDFGFEVSAFRECGATEVWWIAPGGAFQPLNDFIDSHGEFTDDKGRVQGGVFVRWRGFASGPGGFGHRGQYVRQFHVVEVLEVRMPSPDDCGG